jgi:hypothetical protein
MDCASLDDGKCLAGWCDPSSGECLATHLPDGTLCSDGAECTVEDVCAAGACVGVSNCFCFGKPDGTTCDDGLACTKADACSAELCVGAPADCSSLGDACNEGKCQPDTGECVTLFRQFGTPCQDGSLCTTDDACIDGVCTGAVVDCSGLDTDCMVGVCETATGACTFSTDSTENDGLPCDDLNPCSGGDACQQGTCTALTNLCGVCSGKEWGEPCDDENLCTTEDACAFAGELLACQGKGKDCSGVETDCKLGYCLPETGACSAAPKKGGIVCWDGDSCTLADKCQEGTCTGTVVPTCGAQFAGCEQPEPNEVALDAEPIALAGGPRTILAWMDPQGDIDWFAVELLAGQLLTVELSPHCASTLDTQIAVYDLAGKVPLVYDDDGGAEGGWSKVSELEIPADGIYTIAVATYESSPAGTYLLSVDAHFPPPCQSDLDCKCADLTCVTEGAEAGLCVPKMPLENEPNDGWAMASPLGFGASAWASLDAPGDVDWFGLELEAGVPISIGTAPYCGAVLDPQLGVYDSEGLKLVAYDANGAGGGHALVGSFLPESTGTYYVKVSEELVGAGAYVVSTKDLRCLVGTDCTCPDQLCPSDGVTPTMCAPKAFLAEPADGQPPVLEVGARVQAQVDAAYDADAYSLTLPAGVYAITTSSYCGEEVDTLLALSAEGGAEVLAQDDDSGAGFFAALAGFEIAAPTTVTVEVSLNGPGVGTYVLEVVALGTSGP